MLGTKDVQHDAGNSGFLLAMAIKVWLEGREEALVKAVGTKHA